MRMRMYAIKLAEREVLGQGRLGYNSKLRMRMYSIKLAERKV